jgi:hypothetical protein
MDVSDGNRKMINEIFESKKDGEWHVPNPFIMDVVLQKFDTENANKRIYPEAILKREVEKYQRLIREKMAFGECNHPAEAVIDLGRVAINVIECHWEGRTLVGKVEFNLTEGFRRYGICSSLGDTCANLVINGFKIGVSSRGVGSVESRLGKSFVAGDFELLCFDVVATPSTRGAYIGRREDLVQYIESDESNKDKSPINEKIERINKILS